MLIRSYFPFTLVVDGESLRLRIKRMSDEDFGWFDPLFSQVATPTIARFAQRRPEEMATDEKGDFVVSFEEVILRRLTDMDSATKAMYQDACKQDEVEARQFLRDCFERFVTVESELVEELADGTRRVLTTGLDLIRLFGARADVLNEVLGAIKMENTLSEDQKKVLRSRRGFSTGSPTPKEVGPTPETIASSVGTEDSAPTEDAAPRRRQKRRL